MRNRVVRALIFLVIAIGGTIGIASAAGAFDGTSTVPSSTDEMTWD
jgi:uncharacterized ion transporter superfamily protein YfcC